MRCEAQLPRTQIQFRSSSHKKAGFSHWCRHQLPPLTSIFCTLSLWNSLYGSYDTVSWDPCFVLILKNTIHIAFSGSSCDLWCEISICIEARWSDISKTLQTHLSNPVSELLWVMINSLGTLSKRLDAAHHRWLRSILGVSWKDKVTNEEVKARTRQQSILNTLSGRRLRWLGHTIRMDHHRITHQALYWEVPGFKRRPGRPRTNWRGMVKKHLRGMGLTWEEAEVAALNRQEWRRSVAEYVHVDVGWIKSSQVISGLICITYSYQSLFSQVFTCKLRGGNVWGIFKGKCLGGKLCREKSVVNVLEDCPWEMSQRNVHERNCLCGKMFRSNGDIWGNMWWGVWKGGGTCRFPCKNTSLHVQWLWCISP